MHVTPLPLLNHEQGTVVAKETFTCSYLFLAAGSIGTTELLLRANWECFKELTAAAMPAGFHRASGIATGQTKTIKQWLSQLYKSFLRIR